MNIAGDIGVPGNEVVSDEEKAHDDTGELHTKTGIYMGGAMVYIYVYGHTQYISVGFTVQADSSWCGDARAEGRLMRAHCSSTPSPVSLR